MYALNIDPANPKGNPSITELKKLGVRAVRFTYKDTGTDDKPSPEQLQFYANQVEALHQVGIETLIIFSYESYPNAPTENASDEEWETYIHHFSRRAGQMARALAHWNPTFQIWNEPDLPPDPAYIRTMSPANYGKMLQQCYNIIKAVDPDFRVLAAGLGSGDPGWLRRVMWSLGGTTLPADAIAIHPYGQRPEPDFPTADWGFGYIGDLIINYRRATPLPIVITEIGVEHLSALESADYLRRFYQHIKENFSNVVERIFWFCYSDGMVSPFGLVDGTGKHKPAYYVFKSLAMPAGDLKIAPVMEIVATVNQADYDSMRRDYAQRPTIAAELSIDGAKFAGAQLGYRDPDTLHYPKRGFALQLPADNPLPQNVHRLNLSASYPDKSLIRERLSFDLFAQSKVSAPKTWHVHFTLRNKDGNALEQGVYTAIENVDADFFQRRDATAGTLYHAQGGIINGQFTQATLSPHPENILRLLYKKLNTKKILADGFVAEALKRTFKWERIETADADTESYADLAQLITDINRWGAAIIDHYLESIFNLDSLIDWIAINTLVQSNDTYTKNYFLHNRVQDNKWEILPWDYDLTFGRNWNDYCGGLCDDLSEGTSIKGSNQMLNELSRRVLENPTYYHRLRVRLRTLLDTIFTPEALSERIDAYYAQISPYVYTDTLKWGSNVQFEEERERLKNWIIRRRDFIERELADTPAETDGDTRPDTVITQIQTEPLNPATDTPVTFIARVKNQGAGATGNIVGVAFLIDGQYITFGTTGKLAAGAEQSIRAVSTWRAKNGTHKITAVVDDVNRYPEVSEDNNTAEQTFFVTTTAPGGLSDVTVRDIAFERTADGQVRLAAQVVNQGENPTADVVGTAFFIDGKYATFGVISPLAAGKSQAIRAQQSLPLKGSHNVTAIVDDINRFPETDEGNNQLSKNLDFGTPAPPIGGQLPDAILVDVRLGQGRFSAGDTITFEAVVQNIGTAPTGDVVGVAFLIDGQYITFGTAAAIAPNESQIIKAVSPWQAQTGQHRITAVVDDINRFPEILEDNNRLEKSFTVLDRVESNLPDSIVSGIGFSLNDDGMVLLNADVANIGDTATPDAVGVAFFVDDVYATYGIAQAMSAHSEKRIHAVKTLSLSGTHKITAIVDDVNRYDEVSHQNNTLSQTITFAKVERRAIWITRYDWTEMNRIPNPSLIDEMVEDIAQAGFNTIFFQVRSAGDAYYTPGLEPWAARLTGTPWKTLGEDPGWDPLARMLEKAHALGLEVHAFLNMYTAWLPPASDADGKRWPPATTPPHMFDRLTYSPEHGDHPGEHSLGWTWRQYTDGDSPMQLQWGRYLWASPGVDAVQNHLLAVVDDVVTRYAIDGIHLDQLRYAGETCSFDPHSINVAGIDKTAERDQWQRERITTLVRQIYIRTKAARPEMLVSAAVWHCYLDKWNLGLSEGFSQYYQDSKAWLADGVIDAIVPMLYDGKADDFEIWEKLMLDFVADSAKGQVLPGIGGAYDSFAEIEARILAARNANAPGHAIFSYQTLKARGYLNALAQGVYAVPAVASAKNYKRSQ